jgi:hypothetical protein
MLMGVDCLEACHDWPEDIFILKAGTDAYMDSGRPWNHTGRLIDTFDCFLQFFDDHDFVCIIEYDSIFLKPIPALSANKLTSPNTECDPAWGAAARRFYTSPWIADKAVASKIVATGRRLISEKRFDNGSPDVFLGLVLDHVEIEIEQAPWAVSVNGIDGMNRLDELVQAARSGIAFIHGIQTETAFKHIMAAHQS